MSEPIIATSWDQLPPNVIGEGIEYSTRILCRQHQDMQARILDLEAMLTKAWSVICEADDMEGHDEQLREFMEGRG